MSFFLTMKYYTDGSYRAKTKTGAYGAIGIDEEGKEWLVVKGVERDTTNNVMEMKGLLHLLYFLNEHHPHEKLEVFCDSEYVVKGLKEWFPSWQKNGFLTSAKKPVKNLELWKELYAAYAASSIILDWVRGHDVSIGNNAVDSLVQGLSSGSQLC